MHEKKMKVLHLNATWNLGGAAIACRRLHQGLVVRGVDSHVLCQEIEDGDERVHGIPIRYPLLLQRIRRRLVSEARRLQVDPSVHVLSLNCLRNRLLGKIEQLRPALVHLHWVGGGFLRIEDLPRVRAPILWTLHDMWPFCGAEHYAYQDIRWKGAYRRDNRPEVARGLDLNRWVWERKLKAWQGQTIHTIGVSTWIDQCLRESSLFRKIDGLRRVIPNGLDETIFRPDPSHARPNGAPRGRFRIAFGAVRQTNPIKGGDLLLSALRRLVESSMDLELITFGGGEVASVEGVPLQNRGQILDPRELAKLYNFVDLMVVPSRLESFGQTAAEAMACGTPVVCFDTSGLRDIVVHKETGYRARCYDSDDLARGIHWCLEDLERLARLGRQASERSLHHFRIGEVARQTIALYEEILS